MIGRLSGKIGAIGADHVLLDVGGVGYVVHISERTRAALPSVGEAASLWTELLVREDLLQLFGFLTETEREWHRILTSVQGIGAKAGMAILGTLGADGVGRAIALGDHAAVKATPGIGPKLAQRVVNELKGKAPQMMSLGLDQPVVESAAPVASGAEAEALSALQNLGYSPEDAARAVAEAAADGGDTATLIRAALKRLAPGG